MKAQASEKFRNRRSLDTKESPFELLELLHPLSLRWARSPSEAGSGGTRLGRVDKGGVIKGGSKLLELKRSAERGPWISTNDGVMHPRVLKRA